MAAEDSVLYLPESGDKPKILVYHQACIGDMLMAIPAFQAIRAAFPQAVIDLFCVSGVPGSIQIQLIEPLHLFDHIRTIETFGSFTRRIIPRLRIVHSMMNCKYDNVFMVTFTPKWYEYFFFQHAGVKNLFSLPLWSRRKGMKRANDILLDSLEREGIPCGKFRGIPNLMFAKEEERSGEALFNSLPIPPGKIPFVTCIGGRKTSCRFPLSRYLPLLNKLIPEFELFPVFLCGKDDRAMTESFIRELGTGCLLSADERLPLRTLICALRHFRFYLGNDTGPIHLAAAGGIPCIGIYGGQGCGNFFHPMGEGHIILQAHVPCSGCNLQTCTRAKEPPCIQQIKDEDIFQAVADLLHREKG